MDPILVGMIVPLGAFALTFGVVYLLITARNKERMALIEKGADPRLFESVKKGNSNRAIKWGIFLSAVGLGIVVAYMLTKNDVMNEDSAYFSMIFIFGGLALVASHLLLRKKESKEEEKI